MNEKNQNKYAATGVGFSGLLTVAFIVLKLCGVIGWKWVWVLAPAWIPLALYLMFLFVLIIIVAANN